MTRILVTGASSFVGAHFCRLASRHHDVLAQYFSTPVQLPHVQPVRLDLTHSMASKKIADLKVEAVVHLACKIKGRPKLDETVGEAAYRENQQMMSTVLSVGKPIVYASSTVVHWSRNPPYVESRREDERRLAESGLPYIILRPSAPYGPKLLVHQPKHTESFHTLVDLIRRSPVVPLIGDGLYRRQPLHVDDFSQVILDCLTKDFPNQGFDVGGAQSYAFAEIIQMLAKGMGRRRRLVSLPTPVVLQLARWLPNLEPSMLEVIDEDETADPAQIGHYLGWIPRDFSVGMYDLLS